MQVDHLQEKKRRRESSRLCLCDKLNIMKDNKPPYPSVK